MPALASLSSVHFPPGETAITSRPMSAASSKLEMIGLATARGDMTQVLGPPTTPPAAPVLPPAAGVLPPAPGVPVPLLGEPPEPEPVDGPDPPEPLVRPLPPDEEVSLLPLPVMSELLPPLPPRVVLELTSSPAEPQATSARRRVGASAVVIRCRAVFMSSALSTQRAHDQGLLERVPVDRGDHLFADQDLVDPDPHQR